MQRFGKTKINHPFKTFFYLKNGNPTQNGFIERFNRTYLEDVLDATIFENLHQVKELTENWVKDNNEKPTHQFRKHDQMNF